MKRFLLYKVSRSTDPRDLYICSWWIDILSITIMVILAVGRERGLMKMLSGVVASLLLLIPLIEILPNVFDPVLVRAQSEEEHQAWSRNMKERLIVCAVEMLYSLMLW